MLKKICRCGKQIPQTLKMCSECEAKLTKSKRKGYKDYKSKRTDIKEQKFYDNGNKDWTLTKQAVKNRDEGRCLLCDFKGDDGYVDEVHHIIELKEDWSRRFDMSNLICLCKRCHFYVHKKYRKDSKSKKEMQDKLRELIKRDDY
ncbi:HNH endonuclease domain protein [[Clostridium] sordellii]|uniref:HNH endonuclease domain protein n=1 Tax=Paraclostridium sordellii TaxID=1505 RepID=A0A0C7QF51_PARSO|nr:HNH endonuclease signature motif containing protein [Paeniclostridium sordellii]CEQ00324.1 HNH endonuclease domain protein [[Clostridium] sordellii] [Paeniclostridium sordellii]CEQ02016.1 HNH endonuclease domain protein [[Clostridium] sordellii] [Paeniclostridium sordellii]